MSRKKTLLVSKQQIWNNIIIYLELFDHRINNFKETTCMLFPKTKI